MLKLVIKLNKGVHKINQFSNHLRLSDLKASINATHSLIIRFFRILSGFYENTRLIFSGVFKLGLQKNFSYRWSLA